MTSFLEFNALHVGISFGNSLAGSIPGAMAATWVARRWDPLISTKVNLVLMIISMALLVVILTGPGQQRRAYIYFVFTGFVGGWKSSIDKLVSSLIIPDRQSTEMMGFFLFVDQWLLFLPLLVYTVMNEAGINPRINIACMEVYLCIALVFLFLAGSYVDARAEVNRISVFLQGGGTST